MRAYGVLLVLLLLSGTTLAAAQDAVTATDVYPLSLSSGVGARIFPSPDAQLVAYDSSIRLNSHVDRYLTISSVEQGDEPAYYDEPEDLPRGFEAAADSVYVPFAWSPDGGRLAVTSQPLVTLTDTDLWIFDVANEAWSNLADDGYSGSITASGGQTPASGTIIDVQPAWSPDGARIATERTVIGDDGTFGQAQLTLIDAETGEATALAPLPGTSSTGATTALSWSPDGAMLAFTLLHRTQDTGPDADNDGLWLVDSSTGDLRQLATLAQVEVALHGVVAELAMASVGPVVWSPDSTRLLLWAGNTANAPIQVYPFIVDVDSGEIVPVPIPEHPRDTAAARGLRPLQAAWSPDGTALVMFTFGLHPDEDSTSLDPSAPSVRGAVRHVDLDTNTSTLIGYLPLGVTPLYYAAWGANQQVVIDGYHLRLEAGG